MKGKVVFITGAAKGIGYEIAREFARAGAAVILSDVNSIPLEEALAKLKKQRLNVSAEVCDVTNEWAVYETINKVYDKYGHIDVLINNAGIQYVSLIEDFPVEKFELLIKVMLVAPFITTKLVFAKMKKQKFGRIINMASINGVVGFAGKAAYNSSKHGVIGLTKVTALEGAAYNITANAICPGYVDTQLVQNQLKQIAESRGIAEDKVLKEVILPMVPQNRLLTTKEVAKYALYLASDHARGITGQALIIDGGYTVQ